MIPKFGYWKPLIEASFSEFETWVHKVKGHATADITLAGLDLYCEWVYLKLTERKVVADIEISERPDD